MNYPGETAERMVKSCIKKLQTWEHTNRNTIIWLAEPHFSNILPPNNIKQNSQADILLALKIRKETRYSCKDCVWCWFMSGTLQKGFIENELFFDNIIEMFDISNVLKQLLKQWATLLLQQICSAWRCIYANLIFYVSTGIYLCTCKVLHGDFLKVKSVNQLRRQLAQKVIGKVVMSQGSKGSSKWRTNCPAYLFLSLV